MELNMSSKIELNIFKCGRYDFRNPFKRIWHNFTNFFKQIKWAYQRATRGYSDWDLWDLDSYYVQLMINSMHDFAEKTNSHPSGMTHEDWQELVHTIARCFEESQESLEDNLESWKKMQCIREKYNALKEAGNEKKDELEALLKWPEQDPDYQKAYQEWLADIARTNAHQEEMLNRGFDLLKEWINHLWF